MLTVTLIAAARFIPRALKDNRFGLCVDITSIHNVQQRVEIVELRERFEADPGNRWLRELVIELFSDNERR